MANAEQLALLRRSRLSACSTKGADERPPVVDQLGEVTEALQSLARVDTTLTTVHLEVQSMLEQAGDLAKRFRYTANQSSSIRGVWTRSRSAWRCCAT